jgi:hypothetical protein
MGQNIYNQRVDVKNRKQRPDIPRYIKYFLLVLLLILLIGEIRMGEFREISNAGWLTWFILFIKIILIIGIIILIWVQQYLKCQITAPTGCTEEQPDPIVGMLFVKVFGTASGAVFGSYTLDVQRDGDPPIAGIVNYPGGGASGSSPVIAGELGTINTTSLMDGAYTITLKVYPSGYGSPHVCTASFNLLKTIVYVNRVAGVQAISLPSNPNPFDPGAELCTFFAIAPDPAKFHIRSMGGGMHVTGAAYIYECALRKIKKYEIRYAHVALPGTEPPQPVKGSSIPALWPATQSLVLFEYSIPDEYQPWTRIGPAATDLINSWNSMTIGLTTFYKLNPTSWDSGIAGSGRFSLLLTAEDTMGITYHDIQHIWLDNKGIIGQIVKLQYFDAKNGWTDIAPCTDINFRLGKIRIMGLAWDPVIDENWWPASEPNDNFDYYNLIYWKQFGPAIAITANLPNRIPALPVATPVPVPTAADAGELTLWDLNLLDAGPRPSPGAIAPNSQLYRGESCSYDLQLFVTDRTIVSEGTTHYAYSTVPIKLVNDL